MSMNGIAVLEKIVILHVWEDDDLDYDMSEGFLVKPGYAAFVLEGTVYLSKVERIYQTGVNRFYIENRNTSSVRLATNVTQDPAVVIPEIVTKLQGRDVIGWLTQDVLNHMVGEFPFQVLR
ncbi:hypothetical protein ACYCSE_04110 [Paenibacillus sp. SEL1]